MYKQLYERINKASKSNSLTFFVGAGVSALSGAPKWSELIEAFCDELGISKDFSSDDFLKIPQKYYYYIDKDNSEYYRFINDCFKISEELKPNIIHSMLYSMNPVSIVTTNFDNLLEDAATQNFCHYKTIACKKDVPKVSGDKYILKIHGDLNHKNIVLKEEDYLNYSENFKLMETLLKAIFSTNTVVFIGYSLNDNNIKLILNWAKTLLDESFNKPIFIYTDTQELDETDLLYEESRGLSVIDYHNCSPSSDNYTERYRCCLENILSLKEIDLSALNKFQLFDYVYNCLNPLNALNALRINDVVFSLNYKVSIDKSGKIFEIRNPKCFEYFIELNQNIDLLDKLDKTVKTKYDTILSVLSKANIDLYDNGNIPLVKINGVSYGFKSNMCLMFDYAGMKKFVSKEYSQLYKNYLKAYYLAKLNRYEESLNMFKFVCKDSLNKKNYILYYLSRINLSHIFQAEKSICKHFFYHDLYTISELDKKLIDSRQNKIFDDMPNEFRIEYPFLENLSLSKQLYSNFYDSFLLNENLQKTVDGMVIEYGQTSLYKSYYLINENLNFYLGNHIFIDDFDEFRNSIRIIMDTVLAKYAAQNYYFKRTNNLFDDYVDRDINLDKIDFYSIINYFDSKELKNTLYNYNIKNISFNNIKDIEKMVCNLINYHHMLSKEDNDYITQKSSLEKKIETALLLLEKMDVSENLINKIVKFLFSHEFQNMNISFKVNFCYVKLLENGKNNNYTKKIIEKALIDYIKKDIEYIAKGDRLDLRSKNDINYWHLAKLIPINFDDYKSYGVSVLVNQIIDSEITQLYETLSFYYDLVNLKTRNNILKLFVSETQNDLKYYLFRFFYEHDISMKSAQINALKENIRKGISINNNLVRDVKSYPKTDKYENLIEVAFWCNSGYLESNDFKEFFGLSDKADFFFNVDTFDYSKFDNEWLFNISEFAYSKISRSNIARKEINKIIKQFLQDNTLNKKDYEKLTRLYINYFS